MNYISYINIFFLCAKNKLLHISFNNICIYFTICLNLQACMCILIVRLALVKLIGSLIKNKVVFIFLSILCRYGFAIDLEGCVVYNRETVQN